MKISKRCITQNEADKVRLHNLERQLEKADLLLTKLVDYLVTLYGQYIELKEGRKHVKTSKSKGHKTRK